MSAARRFALAVVALAFAVLAVLPAVARDASLGSALFVLEDRSKACTIHDVASPPLAERFQPLDPRRSNVGFTESAYWVRVELESRAATSTAWMIELYKTTDRADLWTPSREDGTGPRGRFEHHVAGSERPFSAREVRHGAAVFRVELAPHESRTVWLRIEGGHALVLAPTIRSEDAFFDGVARDRVLDGAFYGLLMAMALYNLVIFVISRDQAHLFYFLFQVFTALGQGAFDGLTYRYLWPEHPELAARSELFFLCAAVLAALGFTRRFLDTKARLPRADRALRLLGAVAAAFLGASLLLSHTLLKQACIAFLAVASLAMIVTGALAVARRSPNASLFLAAWLVLLAGTITEVAATAGLLPTFVLGGPKIGSTIEALLLLTGLARRMMHARREKDRLQIELAESRLAYAHTLEQRVEERTRELAEMQGRMIGQARMASLGHLVAGVAHEIGNPLNFSAGGLQEIEERLRALGESLGTNADARTTKALSGAQRAARLAQDGTERIRKILANLRGFAGGKPVPARPTDVRAEIDAALAFMNDRLDQRKVRVEHATLPLPEVLASPGELGQVLINLILNSIDAMPDGGEIRIEGRRDGDRIEIVVRDTGPGIAPEHRDAVFDPFFTTRAPGEGTGLGLYVSHEIVARHGGQLRLLPSDVGAAFSITLPVAERDSKSRDASEGEAD